MISSTSSPSAKDTPKMADAPDTNGTPPTDPSFVTISKPSTLTTEQVNTLVEDMMKRRHGGKIVRWPDWKYQLWLGLTKAKHLVGIHTFIPLELWDRERDTISFAGDRCWICNEQR